MSRGRQTAHACRDKRPRGQEHQPEMPEGVQEEYLEHEDLGFQVLNPRQDVDPRTDVKDKGAADKIDGEDSVGMRQHVGLLLSPVAFKCVRPFAGHPS